GERGGATRYQAPEVVCGRRIDARADVYACAAILSELVSGEPPAPPDPEAPATITGLGLPAALEAAIARGLEPRPEARFASAGELREAIEAAVRELGPAEAPTSRLARAAP